MDGGKVVKNEWFKQNFILLFEYKNNPILQLFKNEEHILCKFRNLDNNAKYMRWA